MAALVSDRKNGVGEAMSQNYKDWAHLNEEGLKEFSDIFPEGIVPIISMVPIVFEHPQLAAPEKAYLLRGSDLTENQIKKLIDKLAQKFSGEKDEIRKAILSNDIPVREKLTTGTGTKRIYMYMNDDYDEEEYENEDDDDWDEDEEDWM